MSFVWASKKPKDGVATLYESNITLNKAASTHFERAYSVLLGYDEDNGKIAVKPISKEDIDLGTIPEEKRHKITVRPSYARVSNKKFMKEVSDKANLNLSNNRSYKFKAFWSRVDSALIINLKDVED
jgi:hypothetical protein